MALDLAGGKRPSAGAEGTMPAHCRRNCRLIQGVTGSNSRGNDTYAAGRTRQFLPGPVDLRTVPVNMPSSPQNAGPGQSSWQALPSLPPIPLIIFLYLFSLS
jgi:hypothetical protein